MSDCGCTVEVESRAQARVLWILLAINGVMFVTELPAGLLAESAALIADSFDMFADAAVYAVALYAVFRDALAHQECEAQPTALLDQGNDRVRDR